MKIHQLNLSHVLYKLLLAFIFSVQSLSVSHALETGSRIDNTVNQPAQNSERPQENALAAISPHIDEKIAIIEQKTEATNEWTGYLISFWMTLSTLVIAGIGIITPLVTMRKYENRLEKRQIRDIKFLDLQTRYALSNNKSEQIEYLNEMISLNPDLYELYIKRGNLLIKLGELVNYNAGGAESYYSKDMKKAAISDYNRSISLVKENKSRGFTTKREVSWAYLQRGQAEVSLSLISKAIQSYEKAIEYDSEFAEAYQCLGDIYYNIRDMNSALKNYELAKIHSYDFELIHFVSASSAYSVEEFYENAIEELNKAYEINPNNVELLRQRAFGYIRKAKQEIKFDKILAESSFELAINDLNRTLELEPNYISSLNNLGYLYIFKKDYEKARKYLNRCISFNPTYALAYKNLAIIDQKNSDYDRAIKNFETALYYNPSLAPALKMLGDIFLEKEDYTVAERYYTKAIRINANYKKAYQQRANIYSLIDGPNDLRRVQQDLEKAKGLLAIDDD